MNLFAGVVATEGSVESLSSDVENIHLSLRSIVSIAHKSKNSIKGGIEVRLIDWISSCSLIIIDPKRDQGPRQSFIGVK